MYVYLVIFGKINYYYYYYYYYYGVKGTQLDWFSSYLSNKSQYVDFNGVDSCMLPISTGVPQGSILGPLLFLIYTNDIYKVCKTFYSILHADDTTLTEPLCFFDIIEKSKNYNRDVLSANINAELEGIYAWLAVNKLSLNIPKTKFMVFHRRQRNIDSLISVLEINHYVIERANDFNFLELTIDESMSWETHIQKNCQ